MATEKPNVGNTSHDETPPSTEALPGPDAISIAAADTITVDLDDNTCVNTATDPAEDPMNRARARRIAEARRTISAIHAASQVAATGEQIRLICASSEVPPLAPVARPPPIASSREANIEANELSVQEIVSLFALQEEEEQAKQAKQAKQATQATQAKVPQGAAPAAPAQLSVTPVMLEADMDKLLRSLGEEATTAAATAPPIWAPRDVGRGLTTANGVDPTYDELEMLNDAEENRAAEVLKIVTDLEQTVAAIDGTTAETSENVTSLAEEVRELQVQLSEVDGVCSTIKAQNVALAEEVSELRATVVMMNSTMNTMREQFAKLVRHLVAARPSAGATAVPAATAAVSPTINHEGGTANAEAAPRDE
jgi:uncharacterized coiled-coil protein SlyX